MITDETISLDSLGLTLMHFRKANGQKCTCRQRRWQYSYLPDIFVSPY